MAEATLRVTVKRGDVHPHPGRQGAAPGAQGLLRGLRKRHLPSARSCQVFFKGLQVSRDQTDVKISLESQIYP